MLVLPELQEVLDLPVLWELLEVLVLRELREPRVPLVLLANKVSPAMWELQVLPVCLVHKVRRVFQEILDHQEHLEVQALLELQASKVYRDFKACLGLKVRRVELGRLVFLDHLV